MMYHLDGRRRRQSLVYFGRKSGDLAYRHTRNIDGRAGGAVTLVESLGFV